MILGFTLGLVVAVPVTVFVASLDAEPDGDAVPVLLDDIVLVELTEAVPVFELVVVAVGVRVFRIVFDLRGDFVPLGLADCVLDAAVERVIDPHAVVVLD